MNFEDDNVDIDSTDALIMLPDLNNLNDKENADNNYLDEINITNISDCYKIQMNCTYDKSKGQ